METTSNKQNRIGIIILGVWAIFFLLIIFSGRLPLYINPKFTMLPWLGAIMLAAMIASTMLGARKKLHCEGMDWSLIAWFLMPIVLSLLVPPAGLGAFIANTRQGQMLSPSQANSNISINLSASADYQNINLARLAQAGHLTSGKVSVQGEMITRNNLPPNTCLLAHYIMVCCAADLRPVTVLMVYPSGYVPKDGQWVNVRGVASRTPDGVVIKADMIEPIGEPNPPYLY